MQVAIDYHPFAKGPTAWNVICVLYLVIFSVYWLYSLVHALRDIHAATDIRHFTTQKLGLSESQLKTVSWPEMAKRIVNVRLSHQRQHNAWPTCRGWADLECWLHDVHVHVDACVDHTTHAAW